MSNVQLRRDLEEKKKWAIQAITWPYSKEWQSRWQWLSPLDPIIVCKKGTHICSASAFGHFSLFFISISLHHRIVVVVSGCVCRVHIKYTIFLLCLLIIIFVILLHTLSKQEKEIKYIKFPLKAVESCNNKQAKWICTWLGGGGGDNAAMMMRKGYWWSSKLEL